MAGKRTAHRRAQHGLRSGSPERGAKFPDPAERSIPPGRKGWGMANYQSCSKLGDGVEEQWVLFNRNCIVRGSGVPSPHRSGNRRRPQETEQNQSSLKNTSLRERANTELPQTRSACKHGAPANKKRLSPLWEPNKHSRARASRARRGGVGVGGGARGFVLVN
jgi:hypothetical protein